MNIHNFSNTISRRSYLYEVFVISHQTSSSITLRSTFSWYRKSSVTGLQDNYINRRSLDRLAPNWVTNEERHMQADDGFGHNGTQRSTWHRLYGGETCDLERTTGFQLDLLVPTKSGNGRHRQALPRMTNGRRLILLTPVQDVQKRHASDPGWTGVLQMRRIELPSESFTVTTDRARLRFNPTKRVTSFRSLKCLILVSFHLCLFTVQWASNMAVYLLYNGPLTWLFIYCTMGL